MDKTILLTSVSPGSEVMVAAINGGGRLRQRLKDMGLKEGVKIKVLHSRRPGPCIISAGNVKLVLGRGAGQKISVKKV